MQLMNRCQSWWLFALFAYASAGCSATYQGKVNDAEVHLVDYFQRSAGAPALIDNMDALGIDHAYVMGLPVIKKWDHSQPKAPRFVYGDDAPVYYYSHTDELIAREVESLPQHQQRRLHPFISGFNTTDLNAVEYLERELAFRPNFWQGIGEIITRHDHLTALTSGEKPKANHPALVKVYQLAAKHDLPVLLHANITSQRENEPLYLNELKEALQQHPDTRFLWAHAGTTSTLTRHLDMNFLYQTVTSLLSEHDNLYILASWSLIDVVMPQGTLDQRWVSLIEAYPERFMVGSDGVGSFGYQETALKTWDPVLSALPKHIAKKVAYSNMLAVLPQAGRSVSH
ncbi:amidohydrolase family protein [Vibrio methylphosphonaticus]|uniref:amidohydrolase family protein n=1 Tax=Vibrio methylphosphonaticus TaxID=2946866 RepID=UPI00202A42C5|nr:amidohydrolase family protein [Vibrio methylphosphonaticus]MCL9777345.1 amidohydrolase [Vibrio methylphosphonaticus]